MVVRFAADKQGRLQRQIFLLGIALVPRGDSRTDNRIALQGDPTHRRTHVGQSLVTQLAWYCYAHNYQVLEYAIATILCAANTTTW